MLLRGDFGGGGRGAGELGEEGLGDVFSVAGAVLAYQFQDSLRVCDVIVYSIAGETYVCVCVCVRASPHRCLPWCRSPEVYPGRRGVSTQTESLTTAWEMSAGDDIMHKK